MSVTVVGATLTRRWPERVRAASRFVRFSAMGATVAMALAGAVTSDRPMSARTQLGIAAIAIAYHCFGFVLNDVVDLEIDRTEPRRAGSPLVKGRVTPTVALTFALVSIPVAFMLLWLLGGSETAFVALGSAIVLGAAYDLLQKRFPWPPVTDFLQGAAWAALGWFGAEVAGGTTEVTVPLLAFFIVFILMTNGIHASLRDLENDRRHGANTTAIVLGAVPLDGGGAFIPQRLARYALVLQLAMIGLSGLLLVTLHYRGGARLLATAAWIGLSMLAVWLLVASMVHASDRARSMVAGTQHLIVALGVVIAILVPQMPWSVRVLAVGGFVGPLLTYGWLIDAFRSRSCARDPG